MLVIGWKKNLNKNDVIRTLQKHTSYSLVECRKVADEIESGKTVKLPADFVLREELEDLNLLVQ